MLLCASHDEIYIIYKCLIYIKRYKINMIKMTQGSNTKLTKINIKNLMALPHKTN